MAAIYALAEPDTLEVKYVGYANNPAQRLKGHLNDAASPFRPTMNKPGLGRKSEWIRSLLARGLMPAVLVLMNCELHEKAFYEAFWVDVFGPDNLLNIARTRRDFQPVK